MDPRASTNEQPVPAAPVVRWHEDRPGPGGVAEQWRRDFQPTEAEQRDDAHRMQWQAALRTRRRAALRNNASGARHMIREAEKLHASGRTSDDYVAHVTEQLRPTPTSLAGDDDTPGAPRCGSLHDSRALVADSAWWQRATRDGPTDDHTPAPSRPQARTRQLLAAPGAPGHGSRVAVAA